MWVQMCADPSCVSPGKLPNLSDFLLLCNIALEVLAPRRMKLHSVWKHSTAVSVQKGWPLLECIVALLHHLCSFPFIPRLFPGRLPQDLPAFDLLHAHDHPPGCSTHSQEAAECCIGDSCPLPHPHCSQRGGPTVARVSPSEPLKPGKGRGCPELLTWGGGQPQPPTSHRGRRARNNGQWRAGSNAGQLAVRGGGWGGGGSTPSPKQADSASREQIVAGVSPRWGPQILRVSCGEEEKDCCNVTSGLNLSRALVRGCRAPLFSSKHPSPPPSAPQSQGGKRSQLALLPEPGWSGSPGC